MPDVVGVDAAGRLGWVAVALREGRLLSMSVHLSLADVVGHFRDASAIGVDVPLGHDDPRGSVNRGRRACDEAARRFLDSGRQASVFWVPPPAALGAPDHQAAIELCRSNDWLAPSAQTWAIRPRILEAQGVSMDARVHEVHPEVSFRTLRETLGRAGPLQHSKSSLEGRVERLELLHAATLRPERSFGGVGRASPEDVLDATIAAWSAGRIAAGIARTFPEAPPRDPATGRVVAIWA